METVCQEFDNVIFVDDSIHVGEFQDLNEFGENMCEFDWDGPSDSDEEIECMADLKNDWEKANGVKFSKNGLIEYIENFLI